MVLKTNEETYLLSDVFVLPLYVEVDASVRIFRAHKSEVDRCRPLQTVNKIRSSTYRRAPVMFDNIRGTM